MLELVAPAVRARGEDLRRDWEAALPFRHLIIDEFLEPEYCQQLIDEFPPFDPQHALDEFGEVGGKAVFENLAPLGAAYRRFDELLKSRDFLDFVGRITGIPHLLHDAEYVGGGTHDDRDGQELDPHVDSNYHPRTKRHRRLKVSLFLNPEWKAEWGGVLELHRNPWLPPSENAITFALPRANRCVLFETNEVSWHGFARISLPENKKHLSCRSIAVYFYTRERPDAEILPEHSTVYVARQLPEHIRAGHTLTADDVETIRDLMARRDRTMQFLYARELKFSETIGRLGSGSRATGLASLITQPARAVWQWVRSKQAQKP